LAETARALRYPKLRDQFGIREDEIQEILASLRSDAFIVSGDVEISGVSRDPDDDKYLTCAVEAQADCIVTGDKDLLSLGDYRGIAILRPAEFLARLATD
jgi:putative PIN family toxin of toxin-antitoxin system